VSAPPARIVYFITHPNVVIDPGMTVTEWPLSSLGRMRMVKACVRPWVPTLSALYSSAERKALDGAEILSAASDLPVSVRADLGENDRSATGYLPPAEFEGLADRFFAEPERSVRGWGRAVDEQARIVGAVDAVIAEAPGNGGIAVVSHGAVGALLLAHLLGEAISRRFDQPGAGGGNFFAFDAATRAVLHAWRPIDG
jgi:broad specificity phosphatase PhoE